jgi:hypothetical protein
MTADVIRIVPAGHPGHVLPSYLMRSRVPPLPAVLDAPQSGEMCS